MDEGFIINLADSGTSSSGTHSVSRNGGSQRWTERLKAKRAAKRSSPKPKPTADSSSHGEPPVISERLGKEEDNLPSESLKRKRMSGDFGANPQFRVKKSSNHRDGGVVSSLFTYNPEVKKELNGAEDAKTYGASNAPLLNAENFPDLGVCKALSEILENKLRVKIPTAVQKAVIPRLLSSNRDIFVQAQTGSGKTLAYILPLISRLMKCKNLNRKSGLFAIILVPTRELCAQVLQTLETVTQCCHHIVSTVVLGGEKKKSEKARLRKGINILVATPGRLADHVENTKVLNLKFLRWLILDEGDRLMELGFQEAIGKILQAIELQSDIKSDFLEDLPSRRVTVLCSATLKNGVESLGEQSLKDAEEIFIKDGLSNKQMLLENGARAPSQLIQKRVTVPAKLRLVTLAGYLRSLVRANPSAKAIVFVTCSDSVDFTFAALSRDQDNNKAPCDKSEDLTFEADAPVIGNNTKVFRLHGSLTQAARTQSLSAFNRASAANEACILVCTDVASRGLDIPGVTDVIEYDPAFSVADHLHRVGRTARAGLAGTSLLCLLPGNEEKYADLIQPLHLGALQNIGYEAILRDGFGQKSWQDMATEWHLNVERWIVGSRSGKELASNAFTSHIRAYATHLSSERSVFNLRELHLGHLAKAFGLRETPGNIRHSSANSRNDSKKGSSSSHKSFSNKSSSSSSSDIARDKMLKFAKMHERAGLSEFNIS